MPVSEVSKEPRVASWPLPVTETGAHPGSVDGRGRGERLPLLVLRDGVIQGKGVVLLVGVRHKVAEHDVSVDASNPHPGARLPRVLSRVQQLDSVLVVLGRRKAVLNVTELVVGEGGTRHQQLVSRVNLKRLFTRVAAHALLRELHVDFAGLASEVARSDRV